MAYLTEAHVQARVGGEIEFISLTDDDADGTPDPTVVTQVTTDIDSLTPEQREAQLDDLELRDISDHKLRKVLRDLDLQTSRLSQDDQACEQGEATAI